jgi:hypothetical protein
MPTPAERLKQARIAKGFASAREAARHHGWNEVTYASHENGIRGLRVATARVYAKAFSIPLGDLLGAGPTQQPEQPSTVGVKVLGDSAMGLWRDRSIAADVTGDRILTVPGDNPKSRFALRVADQSINKLLLPGEYAICEPVALEDIEPGHIIAVRRLQGGLVETSIRRVSDVSGSTLKTSGHSTDSRYAALTELRVGHGVDVLGRVVGKYADFHP